MRILLTNDDGVDSPGIRLLADGLRKAGHRVVVVAPESDQSGVSHAISFFMRPCKFTAIGEDTWSCGGSPVDCVVVALLGGLPEVFAMPDSPPDMVVSGINRGANLGSDIVYSGTAAAARQGSLFNIPSAALSLIEGDEWYWDMAVSFAVERLDEIKAYWRPDSFVNVNIPNRREKPRAIVHAFPSFRYYNDSIEIYDAPDGYRYCFARTEKVTSRPERGCDDAVTAEGSASVSEIYIHPVLLELVKEREREGDNDGKPAK
jgi:5'-nucleotidase